MKNFFLFSLSITMLGSFAAGIFYFYNIEVLRAEKRATADECYVEELRIYLAAHYKYTASEKTSTWLDLVAETEEKMLKDGYTYAEILSLKNTAIAMTI